MIISSYFVNRERSRDWKLAQTGGDHERVILPATECGLSPSDRDVKRPTPRAREISVRERRLVANL